MEHVSVKVALTHRVFLRGQVYRMPRNVKGIGRTGKKHKKPADGGSPVMLNEKGITGPLFTPLQDTTNEPDGQAEEASSSAEQCALADAVEKLRPFDPEAYIPCPPSTSRLLVRRAIPPWLSRSWRWERRGDVGSRPPALHPVR